MEQQFKKIIQKIKAWDQGSEPLARTFEAALFKDSHWPFVFDDSVKTELNAIESPIKTSIESSIESSQSLVLFVGDSYSKGEDLLGKMITAMKLGPGEYNRFAFNENLEEVSDLEANLANPSIDTIELLEQIKRFKPSIVVSLGATVTNILLGKRDKLSGIHGQFIEKSISLDNESYTYQLMPIFHPDFLVINPNMKRTAWIDLQKVMERVGKI